MKIAQQFFAISQKPQLLGWGIGGHVFLSPDFSTAVKIHRAEEGYQRELYVYRELARLRINRLHGLNVPKLRATRPHVKLIQMDFVNSPYLLDFAGVRLSPPDFSDETMASWHAGIEEAYGPNSSIAYGVYHFLSQHGMYYMDFRPSNMKLDGLPGLLPMPSAEDDDEF